MIDLSEFTLDLKSGMSMGDLLQAISCDIEPMHRIERKRRGEKRDNGHKMTKHVDVLLSHMDAHSYIQSSHLSMENISSKFIYEDM